MTDMPRVDFEELDLGDDQLIVWKGQPFTGFAVEFFPNGTLCSEVPHVEGVMHGLVRAWHPSGQLREEKNLWQGGLHGYGRIWDEQGRLISERIGELGIGIAEKTWDDQGRLITDWQIGPKDSLHGILQIKRRKWGHLAPPLPSDVQIAGRFSLQKSFRAGLVPPPGVVLAHDQEVPRAMPANYPAGFLAAVDNRLRREGVRTSLKEGALILDDLKCRVRCSLLEGDFHPQLVPLRVRVEHGAFVEPVEDQIAAVGTTPESAISYASDLWLATFFHPFHAFAQGGAEQQPLVMVTTSPSGEHLGWQVFTTEPSTHSQPAPDRMELFKHLSTPLNPRLLDRKAHTLKCFIQKEAGPVTRPGDKVTASCHFDNEEWLEGLSQLFYLGDSWGELPSTRVMRQWFFFRPATQAELGDAWDKLTGAMRFPPPVGVPKQKPWWRFW